MNLLWRLAAILLAAISLRAAATPTNADYPLWDLARNSTAHRFATLFTAQDVRDHLPTDAAIERAMDWCKNTGITHVFLEAYRDSYQTDRALLVRARDRFRDAGFAVSGCVTTTQIGKPSTGWADEISCYTDQPTQQKLQAIFEFAAGIFDEIIIDDFYFTDCQCPLCAAARDARRVTIGDKTYPVTGSAYENYRCELMLRMGEDRILAAAKRVNPRVKIILKYPQWYDDFHSRGYDVTRETAAFDGIWAGTETRDYNDPRWGGAAPYEGYFVMRWLGRIGGAKCGGGWYDYLGTTPATYIEQARQTVLGGARETFLFHYGALQPTGSADVVAGFQSPSGPADILALRQNLPELLTIAEKVRDRAIIGMAAYKPPGSHPEDEGRVFDFVGMMGLPLAPCAEFPTNAPAAFFSIHALKDPHFLAEFSAYARTGRPVLLTDGLRDRLNHRVDLTATNLHVLDIEGAPQRLLYLRPPDLDDIRAPLLAGLNTVFRAPNHVGLYLFDAGGWVVENFNNQPVTVELNGQTLKVEARGWKYKL
ncbi:MAG TPA: hypothetical protein VHB20_10835 [Verrucomicrobiae bacterium]|jgi:hypothetical protein|nr:hypothetical protein [Verrucomicrobiae bacterium]